MQVLRNCVSTAMSLVPKNTFGVSFGPSSLLEIPSLLTTTVRSKGTRNYFPKPREVKRIRGHGLKKRLSTPGGRMIIVNRICKGKHVLAHGW